ncbi:hypothetical protein AVEN_221866-1 [Araneus ventricosus]|uniref:Uncharacterized protein n=1 Tax=Araneus ventricosus TaxID=182803 RepID=A0A4Y2TG45_ARAVE|nr:hypothetical protein AVEN_221866-1 [Araneus ventricosus]
MYKSLLPKVNNLEFNPKACGERLAHSKKGQHCRDSWVCQSRCGSAITEEATADLDDGSIFLTSLVTTETSVLLSSVSELKPKSVEMCPTHGALFNMAWGTFQQMTLFIHNGPLRGTSSPGVTVFTTPRYPSVCSPF